MKNIDLKNFLIRLSALIVIQILIVCSCLSILFDIRFIPKAAAITIFVHSLLSLYNFYSFYTLIERFLTERKIFIYYTPLERLKTLLKNIFKGIRLGFKKTELEYKNQMELEMELYLSDKPQQVNNFDPKNFIAHRKIDHSVVIQEHRYSYSTDFQLNIEEQKEIFYALKKYNPKTIEEEWSFREGFLAKKKSGTKTFQKMGMSQYVMKDVNDN